MVDSKWLVTPHAPPLIRTYMCDTVGWAIIITELPVVAERDEHQEGEGIILQHQAQVLKAGGRSRERTANLLRGSKQSPGTRGPGHINNTVPSA